MNLFICLFKLNSGCKHGSNYIISYDLTGIAYVFSFNRILTYYIHTYIIIFCYALWNFLMFILVDGKSITN